MLMRKDKFLVKNCVMIKRILVQEIIILVSFTSNNGFIKFRCEKSQFIFIIISGY